MKIKREENSISDLCREETRLYLHMLPSNIYLNNLVIQDLPHSFSSVFVISSLASSSSPNSDHYISSFEFSLVQIHSSKDTTNRKKHFFCLLLFVSSSLTVLTLRVAFSSIASPLSHPFQKLLSSYTKVVSSRKQNQIFSPIK